MELANELIEKVKLSKKDNNKNDMENKLEKLNKANKDYKPYKPDKFSNFSRQETKSSDTIIQSAMQTHAINTQKETRINKEANGSASDYLIKNNTKNLISIINTNIKSIGRNGSNGRNINNSLYKEATKTNNKLKITNIIENKKPLKDSNHVGRPTTTTNKEHKNPINPMNTMNYLATSTNISKFILDPKHKSKIKTPSPANLKLSNIPTMTPKSTSHFNLLKVNIL